MLLALVRNLSAGVVLLHKVLVKLMELAVPSSVGKGPVQLGLEIPEMSGRQIVPGGQAYVDAKDCEKFC